MGFWLRSILNIYPLNTPVTLSFTSHRKIVPHLSAAGPVPDECPLQGVLQSLLNQICGHVETVWLLFPKLKSKMIYVGFIPFFSYPLIYFFSRRDKNQKY